MKKIKRYLACMLVSMMAAVSAFAQAEKHQTGGGGGFTIGYGYQDVSPLRAFIPAGVRSFTNDHLLLGGQGHGFLGNFVMGGSGGAVLGDKIKTDSMDYRLGGGFGTFDFGYVLLNREKCKIFPLLGIGGGGYNVHISSNRNVAAKDVVNAPAREISMNVGGFIMDASLNIYCIPVLTYDEKEQSYGGFMTGLRVGYIYSIPSSDWKFAGAGVTGGPRFGYNMAYVKLVIGGFGYNDQPKLK